MRSGPTSSSSGPSRLGTAPISASGRGNSSNQNGRSPKSSCNRFCPASAITPARSGRCSARLAMPHTASVPRRARSRSTRCSHWPGGLPCSSARPRLRPGSGTTSSAFKASSRTGSASSRLANRSRTSSVKCSVSREGATRPIAISVAALSRRPRLRTKRCTPPERAARNPASWSISRFAAKSSASAWVTSAGSESAALNPAGGTKKFRGSGSSPSARSSSASGSCPKRRAMPSRGSARSSPSVRTPIASNAASVLSLQRRTSRGSAASTGSSSALSPMNFCFPAKASQKAARGVGAPASTELQPISLSPRRRRSRSDSRPPKSFRLPETSSSTPSANSSATPGVNCAAHPATPSSASVSVAGLRGATRKAGARASAAVAAIPARTPHANALRSQVKTQCRSSTAKGSGVDEPRRKISSGSRGSRMAIHMMVFAAHGGRHRRQQDGLSEGGTAALEHAYRKAAVARAERDPQRGWRRLAGSLRDPEQKSWCAAAFGSDLQAPQLRVLRPLRPGEHRAAGVRGERLLGRPERFFQRGGAHDDEHRDIDSRPGKRGCVRQVRWSDPGEPQSPVRQGGERGAEQAQLADAFVRRQDLGQRSGGPAAAGKLGVKLGESAGNRRRAGPAQTVAAPDVGALEQSGEREKRARHGPRPAETRASKRPADHADAEAFDGEIVLAQIDDDGLELGVLGEQLDAVAAAAQALHRDLVVHPRHHDLARARLARAVHGEQVAVEDAVVPHAHAAYLEQIVGARLEQGRIDLAVPFDVLLGEDGAPGSNSADKRQPGLFGEADAARGARGQLDRAFPVQDAQMLLGGVGRAVAERLGDLRAGGRKTGLLDGFADEVEDFALLGGELFGHGASVSVYLYTVYVRLARGLLYLGAGSPRERIISTMAQPYESDLTRMIRELLRDKPHIVQEQKKGRALWCNGTLAPEHLKRIRESDIKQQAYVYQNKV